jgi:hypothetical protein
MGYALGSTGQKNLVNGSRERNCLEVCRRKLVLVGWLLGKEANMAAHDSQAAPRIKALAPIFNVLGFFW